MSTESSPPSPPGTRGMLERYHEVRRTTEALCETLEAEDYVVQTMPDVSPTKWHLAHTSWFFETFVLEPGDPSYRVFHPRFNFLFNSYYNAVGPQFPRPERGLLSRPTVGEVFAYRAHVDRHLEEFLQGNPDDVRKREGLIELGMHHEQQHQELLLTDIKHVLARNPLRPIFRERMETRSGAPAREAGWIPLEAGVRSIGHDGGGFSYDNEGPRHRVFLEPARIADRPVTNREYLEFLEDRGYERPELWLSDGWARVREEGWKAPLYWVHEDGGWGRFTLHGFAPIDPEAPVCHVSYYEADAFASWAGARLPTEQEWEALAGPVPVEGNFQENGVLDPVPPTRTPATGKPAQLFGDVWEWTRSAYAPYPGYRAPAGAVGEYNGKFMSGQLVLRGGSCATPRSHIRATYRNFFYPHQRWQFSGIRLARDSG